MNWAQSNFRLQFPAKTLFAGPFVGEFGWELLNWVSKIRYLAQFYERTVVISRPWTEFLYQDFAEFRPWDPGSSDTDDFQCFNSDGYFGSQHFDADERDSVINFVRYDHKVSQILAGLPDAHFRYQGNKGTQQVDYVLHMRTETSNPSGNTTKASRNYPLPYWREIVDHLGPENCVCIGSKSGAVCIDGVKDLRGIPLYDLAGLMSSARMVIGPSSAPAHFASLVGAPQVVWTQRFAGWTNLGNEAKFLFSANPWNSAVRVVAGDHWAPDPDFILEACSSLESQNKISCVMEF